MFSLNAKKVQICEIMSGEFAVKVQLCVKKSTAVFGNFFLLLNCCNLASEIFNQLFISWERIGSKVGLTLFWGSAVSRVNIARL